MTLKCPTQIYKRNRMRYVINSYNTMSAGTSNMTRSILSHFPKQERAIIYFILPKVKAFCDTNWFVGREDILPVYICRFNGLFNMIFRIVFDFLIFPLICLFIRPKSVLVMGNYSPVPLPAKKIVLLRHPFLVDDKLCKNSNILTRIVERIRRVIFRLTLKSTNILIVQSSYIKRKVLEVYHPKNIRIEVLSNPKSDLIDYNIKKEDASGDPCRIILYISRYYPHKNHSFLVELANRYSEEFRRLGIKFYITVDPDLCRGAARLLERIKELKIDDIMINIREVSQKDLTGYYQKACAIFFPSTSETFGNPLVEAMGFGLPIVVPDLGYARAVCEDSAVYYLENDLDDAFKKLQSILQDGKLRGEYSKRSLDQFNKFPTTEQWISSIFEFMG